MSLNDLKTDVDFALIGVDPRPSKFELRVHSEFSFPCCLCDHATRQPEEWCKTNCRHYML